MFIFDILKKIFLESSKVKSSSQSYPLSQVFCTKSRGCSSASFGPILMVDTSFESSGYRIFKNINFVTVRQALVPKIVNHCAWKIIKPQPKWYFKKIFFFKNTFISACTKIFFVTLWKYNTSAFTRIFKHKKILKSSLSSLI